MGHSTTGQRVPAAGAERLFAGPGELRARCRVLDWAATPLGPVEDWPQSLRTAVSVCLASGFPKLVMWGPELVQLYNDAFRGVLQAKHPAGLGQRARDCWPELWDMIGPMYRGVLETGESIFLEDQLFTPERRGYVEEAYFTFSYSAISDESYRPAGILATVIETTRLVQSRGERERALERVNAELRAVAAERERLLAESEDAREDAEQARAAAERTAAALAASEARFRTVQDASPHGFGVHRPVRERGRADGRVVDFDLAYINAAGARILGATPQAMVGRTLLTLFPGTGEEGVFAGYAGVLATGEPYERELFYERDGLAAGLAITAIRVGDEVAVTFADVTERLRAAHERERLLAAAQAERDAATVARAEAEAANRTKGEFLAVMSHELRTPLNAIGGYAELMELGIHGPVTDAQRAALARIQQSQRHLLGLIAGVLDYSRVEAGAVTYRLADVPVVEAVAEAEVLVAPQLRAKGLGYAWSGAPPDRRVRADREKLQQILLNLLGNAVKFTDARDGVPGRIEVTCSMRAASDAAGDGHVCLHIRDTGVGIAPEKLASVFEPFVQADQRLTRPQEGVGLGLAISRDLARGMGGDLTVESTLGVGSTFTLSLPGA